MSTQKEKFEEILKEFKTEIPTIGPREFLQKISEYMKSVETDGKLEPVFDFFSEEEQKGILAGVLMDMLQAFANKCQPKKEESRIITLS